MYTSMVPTYLFVILFNFRDISYIVRETVLLELQLWIQIDPFYFLNDFWMYVYWALGDQSTSVQTIALQVPFFFYKKILILI